MGCIVSLKFLSPKPQYLRMWPYLQTGNQSNQSEIIRMGLIQYGLCPYKKVHSGKTV